MTPQTRIAALLCAGILTAHATADTFIVNGSGRGDFTTIQDAVDAASEGDLVLVAAGTYTSTHPDHVINMRGKWITLRSVHGPELTVIDGEGARFCAQFESGESNETVLDGFTLTGGQGFWGGAIEINGSNPTIQNCILTGNNATRGAGAVVLYGQPVLRACTFTNNTAEIASAVYVEANSSALIEDCLFVNNSAQYFAAGVFLQGISSATIRNCEFLENEADSSPAMSVGFNSTALLEECVFSGNIAATGNTGALSVASNGAATCNSCVFTDNHAAHGGAILCSLGEITLNDCSFSGNSATGDGGAILFVNYCDATLNACVIQSNSAEGDGGGVFIDSTADLSIADSTICGNQSDQVWGDYDNLGGNTVSEECAQECLGDIDGNGEVNGGDLGLLLAAFGTSDPAADLDDNGTVNGGDLGLLLSLYGSCQ